MTEIRLAEDQMQRLMRCILAAGVRANRMRGEGIPSELVWECAQDLLIREPKFKAETKPEPPDDSGTKQPDLLGQISILQMENDGLQKRIEELEKLVPTKRLKVRLVRDKFEYNDWWWIVVRDTPNTINLQISNLMLRPNAVQWITDHGFEVVE